MMFGWLGSCRRQRAQLVWLVDGALTDRRRKRVQRHIETCAVCAAEVAALRESVRDQRVLLQAQLTSEPADVDALWVRTERRLRQSRPVRQRLAAKERWLWRPALAFGVAALLLWIGASAMDEPATVLMTLGVKAPPAAVRQQPDLFKDYAIIQELDVLEHIDTADAAPIEDTATPVADQG